MAAVGHIHVPSTLMSLRCRFPDDTVLVLRRSHLMRSVFVILRWLLQASSRRRNCKTVQSVSSIFLLSIHTVHDSASVLATGGRLLYHPWIEMYTSERIGVDIIIIIIINNNNKNKNNRGIEAILGLCGLTGFWAAHFSLGQYTLLLPVGLHSDTNFGMRVSLVLNMCCADCSYGGRRWIRKLPNGNALTYRTGLVDTMAVTVGW